MKDIFKPEDIKTFTRLVRKEDLAAFESGTVHPVYGTFALGRDVEWACRLFVLEMKEEDEEGIGTFLNLEHVSPALLGSEVIITASIEVIKGNSIICNYVVQCGDRVIAKGSQGQKILKKEKINSLFNSLK
jgi:predicted thioesterase